MASSQDPGDDDKFHDFPIAFSSTINDFKGESMPRNKIHPQTKTALFLVLCLHCAPNAVIQSIGSPAAVSTATAISIDTSTHHTKSLRHVPGEIIVKVRDEAVHKLYNVPFPNNSSGNEAYLTATIPSLRRFKQQHAIRSVERFLRDDQANTSQATQQSSIARNFKYSVEKIKNRYSSRTRRADASAGNVRLDNVFKIKLQDSSVDINTVCENLRKDSTVAYAVPNGFAYADYAPSDPLYSQQWAHQVTSAEKAWDIERGNNSIVVAVVDCGVDYSHPDLVSNILPGIGYDFVDIDTNDYKNQGWKIIPGEDYTSPDADPSDFLGHGTHCAGIVAATGSNNLGVCGVAPGVRIMPVRAGFAHEAPDGTKGGSLTYDAIARAIHFAADNGADVISMSFSSDEDNSLIKDAVDYAASLGVVLVAAAGNSSSSYASFPAGYDDKVIAVAATAYDNTRAYYSNFGLWVDIAAPGGDVNKDNQIMSTVPYQGVYADPGGYKALQGTSMAAPYIAGAAALLLSERPTLTASQVEQVLQNSADPLNSYFYIGTGRVNLRKALTYGISTTVVAKIDSPTPNAYGNAIVDIIGTASGISEVTYTLSYGKGNSPSTWTDITTKYGSVIGGSLGQWNTTGLADGIYIVKLTVIDANGKNETRLPLNIDSDILAGWPRQVVVGNAYACVPTIDDINGDGFQEIVLGTSWMIHALDHNGNSMTGWPVDKLGGSLTGSGEFGSVAVGDIEGDGSKDVVDLNGFFNILENNGVYKSAWKRGYLPRSETEHWVGTLNPPLLADLDNNGTRKVIGRIDNWIGNLEKRIYVLNPDGSSYGNWPYQFPSEFYDRYSSYGTVLAADVDQDGQKEIIALAYSKPLERTALFIWSKDGVLRPGYPRFVSMNQPEKNRFGGPVLADIDNDGDLEVGFILGQGRCNESAGRIIYVNLDGTPAAGWPASFHQNMLAPSFSTGDIDNDGKIETVFGTVLDYDCTNNAYVTVLRNDGTVMTGWPQKTDGSVWGQVSLADIDGDGYPEILASSSTGSVYAWKRTGVLVPGFPKKPMGGIEPKSSSSTVAAGDINNDGKTEIVATTTAGDVYVWKCSGAWKRTAADWTMYQHDPQHSALLPSLSENSSPIVNAGQDRSVAIDTEPVDSSVTLTGSASDDGKPSGTLITRWTKVDGPGNVTFANSSSPVTTAKFSVFGQYTLRLTANDGRLSTSDDIVVTFYLPAPKGVSAVGAPDKITVNWTSVPHAERYEVHQRCLNNGNEATFSSTTTSYECVGLSNGFTYYYSVTAYGLGLSSSNSETVIGRAGLPTVPTSLTATGGNASVSLNWTASSTPSGTTVYYEVLGATSANGPWTMVSPWVTSTTYTFTGLTNGMVYYFAVLAQNTYGFGNHSEVVSAMPGTHKYALPGIIQAEDYKTGGEGVGYHDLTNGNSGNAYRTDNVDIESTTDDGGGHNVGWIDAGEWLAYDVSVAKSGSYTFRMRVASAVAGTKSISILVDGSTVVNGLPFTISNGWQSWTDAVVGNVPLTAGNHDLRILMNTGNFNLNYIEATDAHNLNPIANAGSDQSVQVNATVNLNGTASSDPDRGPQALSYSWTQTGGSTVRLNGAATAQPTFRACEKIT